MGYCIEHLPSRISIGRETETGVTDIRIDCTDWLEKWPGMAISAMYRPPEGDPYIVLAEMIGNSLVWHVSDADTAEPGTGRLELTGVAEGKRKLSALVDVQVARRLEGAAGPMPEAAKPWADEVMAAAATVEQSAQEAKAAAVSAGEHASAAGEAAATAETAAATAGESASAAETAAATAQAASESAQEAEAKAQSAADRAEAAAGSGSVGEQTFDITFTYVEYEGITYAQADKTVEEVSQAIKEGKRINAEIYFSSGPEENHNTLTPAIRLQKLQFNGEIYEIYKVDFYSLYSSETSSTVKKLSIEFIEFSGGFYKGPNSDRVYPIGTFAINDGSPS